jgi:hypothetical protein
MVPWLVSPRFLGTIGFPHHFVHLEGIKQRHSGSPRVSRHRDVSFFLHTSQGASLVFPIINHCYQSCHCSRKIKQ